ncbi:roadblock/LC7 domain-containing protein [Phytomonospora sp. NPDC050363]|uniref:roadblock/LC7 domain-containing protein n=1 Tax=Phytomonospora sp. NPDC050363 TaxID=3155642 RepID=UPI0033F4D67E
MTTASPVQLVTILDELTATPGCDNALIFTDDGLLTAASSGLERADAERLAAALSSEQSLAPAVAKLCIGTEELAWRRTIIDFGPHTVLLMTAGANTSIGVSIQGSMTGDAFALVASVALKQVKRLAEQLGTAGRPT